MSIGDVDGRAMTLSEIAIQVRPHLTKALKPHRATVRQRCGSLTVTVKHDPAIEDAEKTRIVELARPTLQPWEGYMTVPDVDLVPHYSRRQIEAAVTDLIETYAITDSKRCREVWWCSGNDWSDLERQAFKALDKRLRKRKKPETNLAVAERMDWWITTVARKQFPTAAYETGPRYFRVVAIKTYSTLKPDCPLEETRHSQINLCFVCRQTGIIYKADYRSPVLDSARGTVFDAHEVFGKCGLISKKKYQALVQGQRVLFSE